jgi:hypothetical protein
MPPAPMCPVRRSICQAAHKKNPRRQQTPGVSQMNPRAAMEPRAHRRDRRRPLVRECRSRVQRHSKFFAGLDLLAKRNHCGSGLPVSDHQAWSDTPDSSATGYPSERVRHVIVPRPLLRKYWLSGVCSWRVYGRSSLSFADDVADRSGQLTRALADQIS